MELERRRITKEGLKAQRAMQALVAGNSGGTSVKAEDVDFVVSQWRSGKLCRAYC